MNDPAVEGWRWVDQATDDLGLARLAAPHGFHAQACFQGQQAAEKALKGVHYARGARVVLGHSVVQLLDQLDPPLPGDERLREAARRLDQYYIPTRYPNGLPGGIPADVYSRQQADAAIEDAVRIVEAAAGAMPARPAGG